jgi:F-type H+-transporting ATPase subunit delta
MASAHRIYAHALFDAAQDRDRLETVREELEDLVHMVAEVPELAALLEDPEVDSRAKGDVLAEILGDSDELVRNFVRLLAEKGRAPELPGIAAEFDALVHAEQQVLDVQLTTAQDLSDEDFDNILARIEKASGRKVDATRKVDPDLIGGLVLQAGSMRLDASIRGQLDRLRHDLAHARS